MRGRGLTQGIAAVVKGMGLGIGGFSWGSNYGPSGVEICILTSTPVLSAFVHFDSRLPELPNAGT